VSDALDYRRLERWLIVLISLHSYAVGFFLLFVTEWGVAFGGWENVTTLFFPRQAGIFHFVLATGYLIEYFRYRGVVLMIAAKFTAVVFLFGMMAVGDAPWAVPLSAVGDGLMGVVVLWVHRKAAGRG
jgi:hypothetical protein